MRSLSSYLNAKSLAIALVTAAAPVAAQDAPAPAPAPVEASIPFADLGTIRNWRAYDRHSLYVEADGRNWYRAIMFSSCFDLPFVEAIGFITEPNGSFNRFSGVVVRGRECKIRSLVKIDAEPTKESHKAWRAANPKG
jgi:Family of unknown function (DUF6491)